MRLLWRAFVVLLPWPLKRRLLRLLYHYELHPSSHIGLAWVFPQKLVMRGHSRIGHLTVCKGLELLELGESATIGRLNWITAYPLDGSAHFAHRGTRAPELALAASAAITNRHIIDCTDRISIGAYATIAGYRSQLLTHSIDLAECRQDAKPITVGRYVFVGTACTLLGGTAIPEYSVIAANSLLHTVYDEPYRLYAGVPAKAVAQLDPHLNYFSRAQGYVT
ncbi:MAG: acyltransferase [Gammaproteobacteria bacterium]|nr:acyltransferase [Gammaproteobacteria bacterium]MBV8403430.1 acyltransferase [Gammaproteobacteria bacterium]